MNPTETAPDTAKPSPTRKPAPFGSRLGSPRPFFYLAAAITIVYAFLAGLKTIDEFDLGWQMATARWIVQHHQIPSTDFLSYTAAGQPWLYPVGAGLIFYGAYILGGYALISWLTAFACATVTTLLLRRGSLATALLAVLGVPLIASRTTARAEMFTVLLFAAMLTILWQQHETGRAKLWLLPLLMALWVNLHPGFIAGLVLLGGYILLEAFDLLWSDVRSRAFPRLQRAWPWLVATSAATLLNPWGWRVFQIIARQQRAMNAHSQMILEWAPIPLNFAHVLASFSTPDSDRFYVLLIAAIPAITIALWRKQVGAALLLICAAILPLQHMRFGALFAIVVVIVAGGVLTPFFRNLSSRAAPTLRPAVLIAPSLLLLAIAITSSSRLLTNRFYLSGTNLSSFGTGLSWWFPEKAADFVEREKLPGPMFNSAEEGGYLSFRLGPAYQDYVDSRDIPFGTDLLVRSSRLRALDPASSEWKQEIERYGINFILLPIGRYQALQFFPMLKKFCDSDVLRPVYLDEVSVIFVRRQPQTEDLIRRLQIDCATAPLPVSPDSSSSSKAFNQWANAASVLQALGRNAEAFTATNHALQIFPSSGYLHFIRAHMYQDAGDLAHTEQDYLQAVKLEPNLVAPWSALAAFFQQRGRMKDAISAWEHAADTSRWPWEPLISLGFANLQDQNVKDALAAFDRASDSLPSHYELLVDNSVLANIAHGRSRCYFYMGDLSRAISFEEQAAQLIPDPNLWLQLAALYERAGRIEDANRIRAQAMLLTQPK